MWYRSAAPGELPDLRQCSDIYWALWVRENPNVKNLRVYGAHHVINDNTVLLTSRAFKNKGIDKLTVWPGLSFSADTDEGRALIGTSSVCSEIAEKETRLVIYSIADRRYYRACARRTQG
jgi:hypothetical protein